MKVPSTVVVIQAQVNVSAQCHWLANATCVQTDSITTSVKQGNAKLATAQLSEHRH